MTAVKYYAFSQPQKATSAISGLLPITDSKNPVFNFNPNFFSNLHSIKPDELARSVPFVSLKSVDLNGEVIENFNLSFFKGIDYQKLSKGIRYSDRPVISLKDLELKSSNAYGYLYYVDVTLSLKIHSPEELTKTTITSLVFPGMPHILEYGWSSPNEELSNSREKLLFHVVTYDLNIDEAGQIDLIVHGSAMNDKFNNVFVGDVGDPLESEILSEDESDSIYFSKKRIEKYIEYLNDTKKTGGQQSNDYDLVRLLAENFKKIENKARGVVSKNFKDKLDELMEASQSGIIRFHDLIFIMCDETFSGLANSWCNASEFKVIYGDVNKTIKGTDIPTSLADFPIDVNVLMSKIKQELQNGFYIFTVKRFLNMIIENFIENENAWKNRLDDQAKKSFNKPDIIVNFNNRKLNNNEIVIELLIHDVKYGVPSTTKSYPKGKSSKNDAENSVINDSEQPLSVLKLGHANSFIKKLNMSQISDQAMKSVLIQRMAQDRPDGPRSTKIQSEVKATGVTPLTLPLKGDITVLGHTEWKPFRSVFLDTGIFLINGVYQILEVKHNLNADGFSTNLILQYT